MDGGLDLTLNSFSTDEEDFSILPNDHEAYFPTAGDIFESGNIFLPNEPIKVEVTHVIWSKRFPFGHDRTRSPSAFFESQSVTDESSSHKTPSRFEISITHGPFEWQILRKQSDLVTLQRDILVDQVKRRVKQVTHYINNRNQTPTHSGEVRRKKLAAFPKRQNVAMNEQNIEDRKKVVRDYLQSIMEIRKLRYLEGVLRFFEISPLSFRLRLGTTKFKEGPILKIPKARRMAFNLFPCCGSECFWQARWLVLRESYLVMLKPQKLVEIDEERPTDSQTSQSTLSTMDDANDQHMTHFRGRRWHRNRRWRYCKVFLMDKHFCVRTVSTGIGDILHFSNMHGELKIRATHGGTGGEWVDSVAKVISQDAAVGYKVQNPHDSFAPVRSDGRLMLCIDGASYMESVADAIAQARHEIFITDWWLSPEIFLKRPNGMDEWRLDLLLKRKAESGVRVCIMIYREVALALPINSKYTSKHLSSLHRNIHVIRHPDHIRESVLFWSHHEKLVVVDQSIAFMGGIDLCYGRWDRTDHPLLDIDRKAKTFERKTLKQVKLTDLALNTTMLTMMPLRGNLPIIQTSQLPPGVISTDAPPEEPPDATWDRLRKMGTAGIKSEVQQFPKIMNTGVDGEPVTDSNDQGGHAGFSNFVNTARIMMSWKRQAHNDPSSESDKCGIKLLPDGQMALRASRRRKSFRYHKHSAQEKTVDIYVPNVGRVALPMEPEDPTSTTGGVCIPVSSDTEDSAGAWRVRRRHSISLRVSQRKWRKRVRSYSVANCTNIELTPKSPPAVTPGAVAECGGTSRMRSPAPEQGHSPVRRKSRFGKPGNYERLVNNVGNRLQGLFGRVGSIRRGSPLPKHSSDDSDDSDDLEYDNLGFRARLSRGNIVGRHRKLTSFAADDLSVDDFDDDDDEEAFRTDLSALSKRFNFVGKDYGNWLLKDAADLHRPEEDLVDRTNVPRMPWHDCGCAVSGKIASDFARHFIQRWNATRIRKVKRRRKRNSYKLPVPPMLLPCPPCDPWINNHLTTVGGKRRAFPCQLQALRSAGRWSLVASGTAAGGNETNRNTGNGNNDPFTEASILTAYIDAIRESEHYIYIENQFYISWLELEGMQSLDNEDFVSDYGSDSGSGIFIDGRRRQSCVVQNPITQAIYERVLRAHREKKKYRVYIILPLLPGFSGDPGSRPSGISIHTVLHYTRNSLFKGPTALIPRLLLETPRPYDYISVCGLRTHAQWPDGLLTTELIYVHCKLMVVDDRKLIIGSANINDRSLLGYRDSELAMIAEDTVNCGSLMKTTFAGTKTLVGKMARRFRKSLMAEHLGVLTAEGRARQDWDQTLLDDPVCDKFFNEVWLKTANNNSEIYEKVFSCLPSDNLHSFEEVKRARTVDPMYLGPKAHEAFALVKEVRGHLVRYPEDFLLDEDLTPPVGTKENVISEVIWT